MYSNGTHLDPSKAIIMDMNWIQWSFKCSHHLLSLLKHSSNGSFYVDKSLYVLYQYMLYVFFND